MLSCKSASDVSFLHKTNMSHDCDLDGSPDDPYEFSRFDAVQKIALLTTTARTLAINASALRHSLALEQQRLRPQRALAAYVSPSDSSLFHRQQR